MPRFHMQGNLSVRVECVIEAEDADDAAEVVRGAKIQWHVVKEQMTSLVSTQLDEETVN